jgi:hypothetical protein
VQRPAARGAGQPAYAELVALDAALVAPRPPSLSAIQAASLPLAGATAVQLLDRLDPKPGVWLLVHGAAGGVGSLLVQLARARGARVVASASAQREPLLGVPASRSAWRTHSRTAVSVRSKSRATRPIERSPRWHSSTISALNSGVNDRRARGCLPMVSMMDILPGAVP